MSILLLPAQDATNSSNCGRRQERRRQGLRSDAFRPLLTKVLFSGYLSRYPAT